MNGGLTVVDLETLKAKAAACDEALAYLKGRCDSEPLMAVERILMQPESRPHFPPTEGLKAEGLTVGNSDEGVTG